MATATEKIKNVPKNQGKNQNHESYAFFNTPHAARWATVMKLTT